MSELQLRILAVAVALFFSFHGCIFLLRRQRFGLPMLSGALLGLALLGVVPCLAMPARPVAYPAPIESPYLASPLRMVYHRSGGCPNAAIIKDPKGFESPEAAEGAGLRPCLHCFGHRVTMK